MHHLPQKRRTGEVFGHHAAEGVEDLVAVGGGQRYP